MVPFYILHAVVGFGFMDSMATSMGIAIVNDSPSKKMYGVELPDGTKDIIAEEDA